MMASMHRISTRLPLLGSLVKSYPKQPVSVISTPVCRLGFSSTFLSRNSRAFLPITCSYSFRKYSSWEEDTNRKNASYSDSDEFDAFQRPERRHDQVEEKWGHSGSRRPNSYSQRHSRSRSYSYDSNFDRRQSKSRNFNDFEFEEGDDYLTGGYNDRFKSQRLGANIKEKDWNASTLSSIEKNFYVLHPDVSIRSSDVIEDYYSTHNVTVSRGERPVPLSDFHEANFPEKIVRYLERNDWSNPTPIQSLGWPIALSGKNMVGLAQTGSGKTLGFILPALVHIKHQRPVDRGEGPIVLVMAPTRELAQQIQGVAVEYGRLLGIQSCCIFGGQSKIVQARNISRGPELVVATPGRLLDFLESEVVNLDRTTYVVLDEADRMLDMGFEPQIRKVLSQIRPDRQIQMWSATWPKEIQQLAHDFLGEFTQINIGSQELTANPNIEQVVKVCEWREKFGLLLHELKNQFTSSEDKKMPKTLIFGRTKQTVDNVSSKLRDRRLRVNAIHGDKSQVYRDAALSKFRNGEIDILVATDVAARGLDVDDIKVVINFDFPNTIDDYIHRIGRTARASKTGKAVSFVTDDDAGKVNDLIGTLKTAGQEVDPDLYDLTRFHSKFAKKSSSKPHSNYSQRRRPPPKFNKKRHDSW